MSQYYDSVLHSMNRFYKILLCITTCCNVLINSYISYFTTRCYYVLHKITKHYSALQKATPYYKIFLRTQYESALQNTTP